MRRALQTLCALAVFFAFGFSWLWTFTYVNRVQIHKNKDKYKPETFIVTGAEYVTDSDGDPTWWLNGTIKGRPERFIPDFRGRSRPTNVSDLLGLFPKDSRVNVLYNPEASETIIQGETVRVLENRPHLWEQEDALRRKLAPRVLVPGPVALVLYITVRLLNRRHRLETAQQITT